MRDRSLVLFSFFVGAAVIAQACGGDDSTSSGSGNDAGGVDASAADSSVVPDASSRDAASDGGAADTAPGDSASPTCKQTPFDGGAVPVAIAQGQSKPSGVAVDGTSVYFSNQGDGTIVKCPLAGCGGNAPTVIATGQATPAQVAVQGGTVYWANFFGSLNSCPTSGCGDAGIHSYPATSTAGFVLDQNTIYWTELTPGIVASCPLTGCTQPSVLYHGPSGPSYGMAIDGTQLYFLNATVGQVLAIPLAGVPDGGAPRLVASSGDPSFVALGAGNVYWDSLAAGSSVLFQPAGSTADAATPTALATGMPHAAGMTYDDSCGTLYWTANGLSTLDGGRAGGGVFRCQSSGCADAGPEIFGANGDVNFVAMDDGYVYWADTVGGAVWKVAK